MATALLIFFGFIVALEVAGAVANQWQLTKKDRRLPDTFGGRHRLLARLRLADRGNQASDLG